MKNLFLLITLLFAITSCDCTYQYNVMVKNETGELIQIKYKTSQDIRGEIEETITVENGELKKIITSKDIDFGEGCTGVSAEHCQIIVEYVRAYKGDVESKKSWCGESVKLENVDVQQGEFILTYKTTDW